MTVGAIVLAAGNSSRMGTPKQLLRLNERTLLEQTLDAALAVSDCCIVVLGAVAGQIAGVLNLDGITLAHNRDWESGMASSIRCGMQKLDEIRADTDAVILMVCDQPYLDKQVLRRIIDAAELRNDKGIIASEYNGVSGTPVLFRRRYFEDLRTLQGETGARKLIGQFLDDVLAEPFRQGEIDIDTPADWKKLTGK